MKIKCRVCKSAAKLIRPLKNHEQVSCPSCGATYVAWREGSKTKLICVARPISYGNAH